MAKAKHAHTPSTLSLESSVYSEGLTGYVAILNGALLTANAAAAMLDLVSQHEDAWTKTGLCLIGISDVLDTAIDQLEELSEEMTLAAGDIADGAIMATEVPVAEQGEDA
jgi:hypothetical protein